MVAVPEHSNLKRVTYPLVLLLISFLSLLTGGWAEVDPVQVTAPADNGQYKISVEVRLVVLPVSVTDRMGHHVSDLRAEDYRVYEDGQLQKITLFKHEDSPVTVGLVVDNSLSMRPRRPEVEEGILAFAQSSNPHDEMFVVNFSDNPSLCLPGNVFFTDQVSLLRKCLSLAPGGRTALYDAMVLALNHLRHGTQPKKSLIVVSDGGDNASHSGLRQVLQAAEASNVVVYTVGLLDEQEMDQNPGLLKRFAKVTGGEAFFPATPAETRSIFRDIARDLRGQYTLGYTLPNPGNTANYRRVQVRLVTPAKRKLLLRTRTGYYLSVQRPPSSQLAAQDNSN